ncbi:MAG: hypothetical protein KY462_04025 [Actinobacteria bacterium]|nr:hypothetical protein [Actinomycetota bacterium]
MGVRGGTSGIDHNRPLPQRYRYEYDGPIVYQIAPLGYVWPCKEDEELYFRVRLDTTTGRRQYTGEVCFGPSEPPPAGDPEPPTYREVWERVPIVAPSIGVNPRVDGLTGLETWLWVEPQEPVTATVTLNGYTVAATACPVGYVWHVEGRTYERSEPGSEERPAVRHIFERSGDYVVGLETVWEGSFSMTGHDLPAVDGTLGTRAWRSERPYHVASIRSVLIR